MFESKVIEALAFITNELDIKSSKGKNYASCLILIWEQRWIKLK